MSYSQESKEYIRSLLRERITGLRDDLTKVNAELADAHHALKELDAGTSGNVDSPEPSADKRYAEMSYRDAILNHLERFGIPQTTDEITEALLAGGIPTSSAKPRNTVYATLRKLIDANAIVKLNSHTFQAKGISEP